MSEHHSAASEAEQQLVFDLMRERLFQLFGPGGSFRITLGRATEDDAVFVSTVADTIAHAVAAAFDVKETVGRRVAVPTTIAEHEVFWQQIEQELLIRRTGPDSVEVDVERELISASPASSDFMSSDLSGARGAGERRSASEHISLADRLAQRVA